MKIPLCLLLPAALLVTGCSSGTGNSTSPSADLYPAKAFAESRVTTGSFTAGRFETMNHEFTEAMDSLFSADTAAFRVSTDSFFWNDSLVWRLDTVSVKISTDTAKRHAPFSASVLYKNYPVTGVTWKGAVLFCNYISLSFTTSAALDTCYAWNGTAFVLDTSKSGYRLPYAREWEVAARAGRTGPDTLFPTGAVISEHLANYKLDGVVGYLAPVGSYAPNPDSLYDMAGNLWEWAQDDTLGTEKIIKGGSYQDMAVVQETAHRSHAAPGTADGLIGFRVIRK